MHCNFYRKLTTQLHSSLAIMLVFGIGISSANADLIITPTVTSVLNNGNGTSRVTVSISGQATPATENVVAFAFSLTVPQSTASVSVAFPPGAWDPFTGSFDFYTVNLDVIAYFVQINGSAPSNIGVDNGVIANVSFDISDSDLDGPLTTVGLTNANATPPQLPAGYTYPVDNSDPDDPFEISNGFFQLPASGLVVAPLVVTYNSTTAVPEPGSLALCGFSIAVGALYRTRVQRLKCKQHK